MSTITSIYTLTNLTGQNFVLVCSGLAIQYTTNGKFQVKVAQYSFLDDN